MFQNIGMMELIVLLCIALLLFGTRLPGVGKALGEGIRNFKKGMRETTDDEAASGSNVPSPASAANDRSTPDSRAAQQQILAQSVQARPLSGEHGSLHARADSVGGRTGSRADDNVVDLEHRDPK